MSVVIRCPNCGTTRAALGECEACGEPEVRYFCNNHLPGIWLDSRMCPTCGERYGEPTRRVFTPAPPSERARPQASPSPTEPAPPLSERARAPAKVSAATPLRDDDIEPRAAELAPVQKMLAAFLRARYLASGAAAERERRIAAPSIGGCLRRLLLLAVLAFIAIMLAAFFFGRALVHGFQSY